MNIKQASENKTVRWSALVLLMVGITQFDSGFKVFSKKWTADEVAAEAKVVAVEAKGTAEGVEEKFGRYLEQQAQAIETQNKIAEAIQGYAAQQQIPNQAYRAPAIERLWDEEAQRWYCDDGRQLYWADKEGNC